MAPDVFVVLGANSADRCTYLLWEEPKAPDFVLEITSCSTRHEDQVIKRDLYRSLGVREYFLFDPTNDYLKPPLQGLELVARDYRRLPARELAEGGLALASAMLGLELRVTERGLRFHDPHAGEDLPNYAETAQWRERQARLEAESLLAQETAARKAASSMPVAASMLDHEKSRSRNPCVASTCSTCFVNSSNPMARYSDFSSGVERIATSRVSLVDARRRPRLSYTGRQPVEGDVR